MTLLPWEKPKALKPPASFGSARIFSAKKSTDLSMFFKKPSMVSKSQPSAVGTHVA
jgi:hypothetical protein